MSTLASIPTDAAATPQMILMVLGVVGLGVVIMISIRAKVARRQDETPTPRERLERIKVEAQAREGGFAAEASMLDTAQRLAGQLDAKAEKLEQLLAEADERIASLRAIDMTPALAADPYDDDPPSAPPVPVGSGSTRPDPVTEAVYRLADDGRDTLEIARELGEQTGKVELILALREGV